MWQRVSHLVKKEFIQVVRDRKMFALVIMMPIVQLVIFGYIANTDVRDVPTAVWDQDRSPQSRELLASFANSGYFKIEKYIENRGEIDRLLDRGEAKVAIVLPPDLSRKVKAGSSVEVQILIDGTNSNLASIVYGYASVIVSSFGTKLSWAEANLPLSFAAPEVRVWYNPELKSSHFMIPGVICTLLMMLTINLTSMAVVREREVGTLEQLIVTPLRPLELMLGKIIPFTFLGFGSVTLIVVIALLWFRVPLVGSILLTYLAAGLFILTSLGLGLLVSTLSKTMAQAMWTSQFLVIPSMLLSGFIFPIANMPLVLQHLTYLIPLRYFLEIVRGTFLKGAGLVSLWQQILALMVYGLVMFSLAVWRFRTRLK